MKFRQCTSFVLKSKVLLAIFLFYFGFLACGVDLQAQPESFNHPELHWKSIETEHFIVHYHQGTERTANLVAKIAEEIYPHITGFYQYWPKRKTDFIIRDTDDYSNGGAYFYDNKIDIWAENMDYVLRGTHNWLRDVVSHEYAHIVSLQKSFKFGQNIPGGYLQLFNYESERRPDVVRGFPNILVSYPIAGITIPIWFAEGVAQYQAPSSQFDYRDSHREMILRDRVITGNLLNMDQMSVFGKNSIGNESSYNQGYAFVNFLTETFGDSILRDLADQASGLLTLDFKDVLAKVTRVSNDSLFNLWNEYLLDTYTQRLSTIQKNLKVGTPIQTKGIGNLHPVFSPDGKKIAYLKSKADYLSDNTLVVRDMKSGNEKKICGSVASSISWSPDNRYLTYAKQIELQSNGSSYYDLYVFDLGKDKSYRITNGLRATNPDWSHDGNQIVFVVHSDGLTNLFVITVDEFENVRKKKLWSTYYYDLSEHKLVDKIPQDKWKDWKRYYRTVKFWGKEIRQLTRFTNGRQIFHPKWSPDDSYIVFDTSTDFCRDIARIPAEGGKINFLLDENYDERYPSFDPSGGKLFYASDRTGIFNIYSYNLETGKIKPHTNVIGGAFMPTVNEQGELVYSVYKDQGYKIYSIEEVNELPGATLTYIESYDSKIPQIANDDRDYNPLPAKPYKRSFGPVGVMPRILIDYGTLKPGIYFYANEVLNKMFFLGGIDFNFRKDYSIFGLFEFNLLKPSIFLEVYNQSHHIKERLNDPFYEQMGIDGQDDYSVSFNLLEADFGLRGKFRYYFDWKLTYIFSLYRATIGTFAYRELSTDEIFISSPIRYDYLHGHSLSLSLRKRQVLPEQDQAINPRKGYYIFFRYTREWNKFLNQFATNRVIDIEIYEKYYLNRFELDLEKYVAVPFTKHHSITARIQGGYMDKEVDDFFYFFAGGFIGLKGFNYYSIDGRKMAIGSITYRMPLARNINKQLLSWHLDKIYIGAFYQFGDAWNKGGINFKTNQNGTNFEDRFEYKSNIGFQLRLDTFSWYMLPTRIFFEAVYPIEKVKYRDIIYDQEWKFYFGILFDFDIRLDQISRRFK